MDWIFDNLQLIFVIGGSLAWWLNQRKQAADGEEAPPSPDESVYDDPEMAERTRKIREDIQRKIEQRAQGRTQPQSLQTDRLETPPLIREVVVAPQAYRSTTRMEALRQAEILEEQATMMEKLQQAQLMKASAQRRENFQETIADQTVGNRTKTKAALVEELRSPNALRRAFLLREVLGPPVALKR